MSKIAEDQALIKSEAMDKEMTKMSMSNDQLAQFMIKESKNPLNFKALKVQIGRIRKGKQLAAELKTLRLIEAVLKLSAGDICGDIVSHADILQIKRMRKLDQEEAKEKPQRLLASGQENLLISKDLARKILKMLD